MTEQQTETAQTATNMKKNQSDFFLNLIRNLQNVEPKLTDEVVKKAIHQIRGKKPKTIPHEWGGRINHENKPKKGMTAFTLFSSENRPEIRKQFPNLPNNSLTSKETIMVKISEAWKALSETQRDVYKKRAVEINQQYKKDLEKFYDENPQFRPKPKTKRANGCSIFCEENKERIKLQFPDLIPFALHRECVKAWNTIPQEEKNRYQQLALERNVKNGKVVQSNPRPRAARPPKADAKVDVKDAKEKAPREKKEKAPRAVKEKVVKESTPVVETPAVVEQSAAPVVESKKTVARPRGKKVTA